MCVKKENYTTTSPKWSEKKWRRRSSSSSRRRRRDQHTLRTLLWLKPERLKTDAGHWLLLFGNSSNSFVRAPMTWCSEVVWNDEWWQRRYWRFVTYSLVSLDFQTLKRFNVVNKFQFSCVSWSVPSHMFCLPSVQIRLSEPALSTDCVLALPLGVA